MVMQRLIFTLHLHSGHVLCFLSTTHILRQLTIHRTFFTKVVTSTTYRTSNNLCTNINKQTSLQRRARKGKQRDDDFQNW
jgi:hypothetical protein